MSPKPEYDERLLQELEERNNVSFQRLRRLIQDFKKALKDNSEDRDNDNSFTSGSVSAT